MTYIINATENTFPSYFSEWNKLENKQNIANNFNNSFQNIDPILSASFPNHKGESINTYVLFVD